MKIPVERLGEIAEWLRSVEEGDLRMAYITEDHFKSFNSSNTRQNARYRKEGVDIWLMHRMNKAQNRVVVRAMTAGERKAMKSDIRLKKKYEKELPIGFFDKEDHWEIDTWHELPEEQ